ncbi:MAG: peptidoglycan-binding protein [Acetobacteraceae bacterium]|nr:peptidoglycan-binding protein [Acetobacteraceae bacterium]
MASRRTTRHEAFPRPGSGAAGGASAPSSSPAAAQPEPGLTYSQALSPAAIRAVQQRLRETGTYIGALDGVWGPDSQAALERFQQSRGLRVTGQLNQATAATLGLRPADLLAAGAGAAEPARGAQRAVPPACDGFYRGRVDGIWGPGTQAAVERFKQGRGLQVNGQINPATAQALGLDPNNLELAPAALR